ncbi:hypothetical protein GCM10025877_01890 [Agromyces mangrovi Wang et al. 2018]|nr:hypothetical protein GCM10025877_01890 [Agromyces mangrovi]
MEAEDASRKGAGRIRNTVNTLVDDAKQHGSAVGLTGDRIEIEGASRSAAASSSRVRRTS